MKSMIKAEYEGINKSSPNEMGKMHALERIDFILGTLKRDKVVLVTELSKQLNVSEETIRSDLKKLEKQEQLHRVHGGAYLNEGYGNETPFVVRNRILCAEKALIAQRCLPLIKNRETIFLDSSSTALNLAKALAESGKRLTVISNSLEIAKVFAYSNEVRLVILGGELNRSCSAFEGNLVTEQLAEYYISTAFVSCAGVNLQAGITDSVQGEAIVRKAALSRCYHSVLLADETKFQEGGPYVIANLAAIDYLVSDGLVAKSSPDVYGYLVSTGKSIIDAALN